MESTKLNTILTNSNTLCRSLSNIDIIIIASSMVKIWKETLIHPTPNLNPNPNPIINVETRRNQYVKIFINVINSLTANNNLDDTFDLITGLTDNFNYFNNFPIEDIHLNNIHNFNNLNTYILNDLYEVHLSSFNKLLYTETYNFFKKYFDNNDEERIHNTNNYINFLNSHLKKNSLSKTELVSLYLGLITYKKITNGCVGINKDKIIENLATGYYISDYNILFELNKIFLKYVNNENFNIDNQSINYKLVFDIINWC